VNNDVTPTETQNLNCLSKLSKHRTMRGDPNCNGYLGSKFMTLEERLETWIVARCREKEPQPQRVRELNSLFENIYNDRRFYRYRNAENRDYYEDALSLMWRYLLRNLCEAMGRANSSFLETRTYAVGRLLTNLKGHLKNLQRDPNLPDLPPELPSPKLSVASLQFEEFLKLLATDATGELKANENTLRGKNKTTDEPYELTAQTYLLMRHRDEKTIQAIADELGIPRGTLQGGSKPTRWKALERKLAEIAVDSISE
jgi:hypothetical protein